MTRVIARIVGVTKKDFYDNLESGGLPRMRKLCPAQLSTVICQDGVKTVPRALDSCRHSLSRFPRAQPFALSIALPMGRMIERCRRQEFPRAGDNGE